MINFRIITDSSSGISQQEAKELGVIVLPLTLSYKGHDYKDGIDISTNDFYKLFFEEEEKSLNLFKKPDFPKTSQVAPIDFLNCFKEIINNGEIPVVLPISSVLSGTYQSACIAKSMLDNDNVYVVDSNSALGSVKLMIESLASKQFETIEELLKEIEYMKSHLNFYAVPDTLEFLYKGGRLSKTSALVGNLLQLKPIIQLDKTGKLIPIEKVRGLKHAYKKIHDLLLEFPIDKNYPFGLGYSTKEENVLSLRSIISDTLPNEVKPHQISAVVGAHVGPGESAIFYISTKEVDK